MIENQKLSVRHLPVSQSASTLMFYISLSSGFREIDDHHRNPNSNNRDCLVGQLTISQLASTGGSYSGIVC